MRALIPLLLLAGCASSPAERPRNNFEEAMQSYVGVPESGLVGTMGPPTSVYQTPDGGRILTYTRISGNVTRSSPSGPTTPAMTYNTPLSCTVNFTLQNDRVETWYAQGNACR